MASKKGDSYLIGRDAKTGRLMPVEAARKRPAQTVVERMPKPGRGDTGRRKPSK